MRWTDLPIIAFDTETTGLDPFSGDRVMEVALVELRVGPDGRVRERKDHAWMINPGIPIPRQITQITGIRDDDVANAPPFAMVAEEIGALFAGGLAVAHNLPFDHAFLTAEFRAAGVPWHEPLASIDTVDLSMKLTPEARSHKLGDVARRLDVQLVEAHRAANDAAACGLVFLELAKRHGAPDDLAGLLDWAEAIGRPPEGGPLGVDALGSPIFVEGPHAGEPVGDHPLHLAWIDKARLKTPDGWRWRFPDGARAWARRWLSVRTTGRARGSPKSFHAEDWVIDPCITEDRRRGLS